MFYSESELNSNFAINLMSDFDSASESDSESDSSYAFINLDIWFFFFLLYICILLNKPTDNLFYPFS